MSVTFIWHTSPEHKNCPICESLNGRTLTFNLQDEELPIILNFDGVDAWNTFNNNSIAHITGQIDWECYCSLEVVTDFSSIIDYLKDLSAGLIAENVLPRVWAIP